MRNSLWAACYAVAMAAVESAVVVYLRALHSGDAPLSVLQYELPTRLILIEVGREVATVVMILAVAVLAARAKREVFLYFALMFGIWDIFYYVWLWVFIGWPPSLLTWDILFLIPVPWVGPVIAPVIVSLCLIAGSVWLLARPELRLPRLAWGLAIVGALLIVLSFAVDFRYALARTDPPRFRWELFGLGVVVGIGGIAFGTRALKRRLGNDVRP
jgi:hypothetical protein